MNTKIYLIVLFGIVLFGCNKKESSVKTEALPVEVAKPVVKNVTLTRDYPGYLTAETSVDIVGTKRCKTTSYRTPSFCNHR